jgi:hypothetical protein
MDGLLTQEEVDGLPEGALATITWSGGNGPHRYKVVVDCGERFAVPERLYNRGDRAIRTYNPIDFVGAERYHTHVSLIVP